MAKLKVRLKATGQTGTIDEKDYDPRLFELTDPLQKLVAGSAIPAAFSLAGIAGGGLVGGPAGMGVGGFGGYGTGKVVQEELKRLVGGEQPWKPEEAVSQLPTGASRVGLGAYTLGQLAKLIPMPGAGKKIEETTLKYGTRTYPSQILKDQLMEVTRKYQKDPRLSKALQQELKTIDKYSKGGQIDLVNLRDLNELANERAYEKLAPGVEKSLWKKVANVYRSVQVGQEGIAPELAKPLADYSKIQRLKALAPKPQEIMRGLWRMTPYYLGYQLIRKALGKR